ncbi:hypothetical protein GGI23_005372 [Coemansia sp. RSA 2559]|nr:hypothetical protein GGI23_005372 [Coemansia sp. RSA 2559]
MDRRMEEDMVASLGGGGGGSMDSEREMYDAGNSIPIRAVESASSASGYGGVVEPRIVEQEENGGCLESGGVSQSRSSSRASTASRRADQQQQQQQQQQQSHLSEADDAASIHSTKSTAQTPKYMILDPRKLMGMRLPNVLPRNSPLAESSSSVASLWRQRSVNSPTERSVSEDPGRRRSGQGTHSSEFPAGRPLYSAMHMHMVPTSSSLSYSARDGHANSPPPLRRGATSTTALSGAGAEEKGASSSSSVDVPPIVVRRATDDDGGDSNR